MGQNISWPREIDAVHIVLRGLEAVRDGGSHHRYLRKMSHFHLEIAKEVGTVAPYGWSPHRTENIPVHSYALEHSHFLLSIWGERDRN